jgi:GABA(A) receptor-associated protein
MNWTQDKTKQKVAEMLKKHPGYVPCLIINKTPKQIQLQKHKYLVPKDLIISVFLMVIRKSSKIPPEKAVFLLINNKIPVPTETMGMLYDEHKSKNDYLYINLTGENTFG